MGFWPLCRKVLQRISGDGVFSPVNQGGTTKKRGKEVPCSSYNDKAKFEHPLRNQAEFGIQSHDNNTIQSSGFPSYLAY